MTETTAEAHPPERFFVYATCAPIIADLATRLRHPVTACVPQYKCMTRREAWETYTKHCEREPHTHIIVRGVWTGEVNEHGAGVYRYDWTSARLVALLAEVVGG